MVSRMNSLVAEVIVQLVLGVFELLASDMPLVVPVVHLALHGAAQRMSPG